jgi:glycosyltransferase involved in cell wall biosynthesis
MNGKRRLLFISPVIPARKGNGLAMRTGFFVKAYAHRFEIDLAIFPIIAAPEGGTADIQPYVSRLKIFPCPSPDAHFALVAAIVDPAARLLAFQRYGRPSLASRVGTLAQRALEPWVSRRRYDVVHIERLYLAPLAEPWAFLSKARPRMVIDCDDDDARTYRRLASIERSDDRIHAAAWAEAEATAFSLMAQRLLPRFDLAFAASDVDARSLSSNRAKVAVVPNVLPPAAVAAVGPRRRWNKRKTVLFVATMGYKPNDVAARWLITRIWPRLRRAVRGPMQLVIVGSNPSPSLMRLGRRRDLLVTGTVKETTPFYHRADLAVIPVRAGGGTRIKLLEAAAHGVAIVSTTLGAEGTTFRHGQELLLADTEERFIRACADLLKHPERAIKIASRARVKAFRDYNADRWSRRVGDLVTCGLAESKGQVRCRKF